MKEKYYYNDAPLSQYCNEHEMDTDYIRTRIWKKKNSKSGQSLSDNQIVDEVIKAYKKPRGYQYNGMSLRKYCEGKKDLVYSTIIARISSLKERFPNMEDDALIEMAINNYISAGIKIFFQGEPLVNYCEKHEEADYRAIKDYLEGERQKGSVLTDEEIIFNWLNDEHRTIKNKYNGYYKYFYLGQPLKVYCEENTEINYKLLYNYLLNHRNDEEYKNLSDDEYVDAIMNIYEPFELKYSYQGISLRQYCLQNDISYDSVIKYVKSKRKVDASLKIDVLIEEAIQNINRYGIIYYYKDIPLKDYAKAHELNYDSLRAMILQKRYVLKRPLQDVVNLCVERFERKFQYKSVCLVDFCNHAKVSYDAIILEYHDATLDLKMPDDSLLEKIVEKHLEQSQRNVYFKEERLLYSYYQNNQYLYSAIRHRINYYQNKGMDTEKAIGIAVTRAESKERINQINRVFNYINNHALTEQEVIDVCGILHINSENLFDLLNQNFSLKQAIGIVWYFNDKTDKEKNKIISDNKISKVFQTMDMIKNGIHLEDIDIYDLIGLYKSDLYDTRNAILIKENQYIKYIISSISVEYSIILNQDLYKEFISELNFVLINVLNQINTNSKGQMLKFIGLTLKGRFRTYLKKYKIEYNLLSLNDSEEDFKFIVLKYQEGYTDKDLSSILGMSEKNVREKDEILLNSLRENESIKQMKKSISGC